MNGFEKFKEKFYNSLTKGKIGGKKYQHVFKVWESFEMKTIKNCHDFIVRKNL